MLRNLLIPIFFFTIHFGTAQVVINELDLASMSNDFQLLPAEYTLRGKLNGKLSGVVAEDPLMNGVFTLDSTFFSEEEYGVSTAMTNQKIKLKNNHLFFNKFELNLV